VEPDEPLPDGAASVVVPSGLLGAASGVLVVPVAPGDAFWAPLGGAGALRAALVEGPNDEGPASRGPFENGVSLRSGGD
jgi:hypothetical protein